MAEFDSPSPHHESKTKSVSFVQVAFHHKTNSSCSCLHRIIGFGLLRMCSFCNIVTPAALSVFLSLSIYGLLPKRKCTKCVSEEVMVEKQIQRHETSSVMRQFGLIPGSPSARHCPGHISVFYVSPVLMDKSVFAFLHHCSGVFNCFHVISSFKIRAPSL